MLALPTGVTVRSNPLVACASGDARVVGAEIVHPTHNRINTTPPRAVRVPDILLPCTAHRPRRYPTLWAARQSRPDPRAQSSSPLPPPPTVASRSGGSVTPTPG